MSKRNVREDLLTPQPDRGFQTGSIARASKKAVAEVMRLNLESLISLSFRDNEARTTARKDEFFRLAIDAEYQPAGRSG